MNDKHSSKYNMYVSTLKLCTSEAEAWKDLPAYGKAVARLGEIVADVDKLNFKLQGEKNSAESKAKSRAEMEHLASIVGGSLRAYASSIGNETLKSDVSQSLRQISLAKETDADDIALYLHSLGTQYVKEALDFGLNQTELDQLKLRVEDFYALVGKPKLSIAESKSVREQMEKLFKEGDALLKEQLDNMSLRFEKTNPVFYSRYQSSRSTFVRTAAAKPEAMLS